MKTMNDMMVREIMKMLTRLRGGGWCLEWLQPPPKGFNVKERVEREREREMTREIDREK